MGADRLSGSGLREVGSLLWEVVDETSAQMAAAYHGHERSRVRTDEQRRAALWEDLVGGRARDPGFALEASGLLDLPPFAEVLVVLADGVEPRTFESALAPHATAATWRGDLLLGVVALREDRPEAAYDALRALAGVDRPGGGRTGGGRTGGGRARVVSSGVVDGLGEVGLGYQQARAALRSAPGGPRLRPVRRGACGGAAAQRPRRRRATRGPLDHAAARPRRRGDRPPGDPRRLGHRGGSASRAAPLVPCHRNTVLNRLRRVTQVTGWPSTTTHRPSTSTWRCAPPCSPAVTTETDVHSAQPCRRILAPWSWSRPVTTATVVTGRRPLSGPPPIRPLWSA